MRKRKLYVSELVKRYNGYLLFAIMDNKLKLAYVYKQKDKELEQWYDYQVKRYDVTIEYIRIYI